MEKTTTAIGPLWRAVNIIFALAIAFISFTNLLTLTGYFWVAGGFAIVVLGADILRLKKKISDWMGYLPVILPVVLLAGYFGTFATISGLGNKFFVTLLVVMIFYFVQIYIADEIPVFVRDTGMIFAAFLSATAIWAINFFLLPSWWMVTGGFFLLFFLLFWNFFSRTGKSWQTVFILGLSGGLIMVEVSWALLFWPIHFLSMAIVSLTVFYIIYILGGLYFEGKLSKNKIVFQCILVGAVLLVSLLTAKWTSTLT